MELDEFVTNISGEPLSEMQQKVLAALRDATPTGRTRVVVVGDRFNQARAIGNLLHEDFNRLEDRVVLNMEGNKQFNRQLEKTILFGTCYTQCWFDELTGVQIKDVSHHEMGIVDQVRFVPHPDVPADHPTRKREPKGPRGRWGKL
ncbi:hypothetical protein D3C85_379750 [compost metagenome]